MTKYVKCTKCGWCGGRVDLKRLSRISPRAYLLGCPMCDSSDIIAMADPKTSIKYREELMDDIKEVIAFKSSDGVLHETEEKAERANNKIQFKEFYTGHELPTGYWSDGRRYVNNETVMEWLSANRDELLDFLRNK